MNQFGSWRVQRGIHLMYTNELCLRGMPEQCLLWTQSIIHKFDMLLVLGSGAQSGFKVRIRVRGHGQGSGVMVRGQGQVQSQGQRARLRVRARLRAIVSLDFLGCKVSLESHVERTRDGNFIIGPYPRLVFDHPLSR